VNTTLVKVTRDYQFASFKCQFLVYILVDISAAFDQAFALEMLSFASYHTGHSPYLLPASPPLPDLYFWHIPELFSLSLTLGISL
jgi:hypothetical protein